MILEPENSVYGEKSQIKRYYSIVNVKISIFLQIIKKRILPLTMLDLFCLMKAMIFSYHISKDQGVIIIFKGKKYFFNKFFKK